MKNMEKEIAVGSVQLDDWKIGDPLYSEWMLKEPEYAEEIKIDPVEEILLIGEYTLKIDYPLHEPFIEKRVLDKSMTREEVVAWIVDRYHFIYDVENETSKIKSDLIPGMHNRNTTDGKYGIWGHELGDLLLHTIFIDENNEITLGVDS